MADIDVRIRQRSVIEFLTAEGEMPIRIHERLKNVYGDATVDVSTVRRWVCRCKEAEGQKMKTSMRQWLRRQDLTFYRAGIHALVKRWTKTVEMDGLIVNVVVFKLCNLFEFSLIILVNKLYTNIIKVLSSKPSYTQGCNMKTM